MTVPYIIHSTKTLATSYDELLNIVASTATPHPAQMVSTWNNKKVPKGEPQTGNVSKGALLYNVLYDMFMYVSTYYPTLTTPLPLTHHPITLTHRPLPLSHNPITPPPPPHYPHSPPHYPSLTTPLPHSPPHYPDPQLH